MDARRRLSKCHSNLPHFSFMNRLTMAQILNRLIQKGHEFFQLKIPTPALNRWVNFDLS